jgi:hypothetical protein
MTALVEPDFADAALSLFDQAAMSTGKTLKGVVLEMLRQFPSTFSGHRIEDVGKRQGFGTDRHELKTWYFELCTLLFDLCAIRR